MLGTIQCVQGSDGVPKPDDIMSCEPESGDRVVDELLLVVNHDNVRGHCAPYGHSADSPACRAWKSAGSSRRRAFLVSKTDLTLLSATSRLTVRSLKFRAAAKVLVV